MPRARTFRQQLFSTVQKRYVITPKWNEAYRSNVITLGYSTLLSNYNLNENFHFHTLVKTFPVIFEYISFVRGKNDHHLLLKAIFLTSG
jgi:hypothetical protein